MASFNLDNYETVETRLEKFWEKYPNGRIQTAVLEKTDASILVSSAIYAERIDLNPIATGIAEEIKSQSGVNKDAWVENCETSAIGRALANGGFASKGKRPSREEMEKVQRRNPEPTAEQLSDAQTAVEQVADITSLAELKVLYEGVRDAGLLNINVNGKSVNSIITARKSELEKK